MFGGGGCLNPVENGRAELARQFLIELARITIHPRSDFGGEQCRDDAILIRRPDRAVETKKGCTRAFLAAKSKCAVEETISEPLESGRHFDEFPAQLCSHAINHLAAHDGFSDSRVRAPVGPMLEQVVNGDAEIVVRREQAQPRRDDPVPVMVGVAGKGDVETILHADQILHGIG